MAPALLHQPLWFMTSGSISIQTSPELTCACFAVLRLVTSGQICSPVIDVITHAVTAGWTMTIHLWLAVWPFLDT